MTGLDFSTFKRGVLILAIIVLISLITLFGGCSPVPANPEGAPVGSSLEVADIRGR